MYDQSLSLLIPAFNAEACIASTLQDVDSYLSKLLSDYEIIVIDDGSVDNTAQKVRGANIEKVKLVQLKKKSGKFRAISAGVQEASGKVIIFTDADLPYECSAIGYIHRLIAENDVHIVIGDRTLAGSKYYDTQPVFRRLTSMLFSCSVRLLVTGGLFDTQCGLKGFKAPYAKELFSLLREPGYAGDVEILYIALKYNLSIRRIPVRIQRQAPSTVSPIFDGLKMLKSIFYLRMNWSLGRYHSQSLLDLSEQNYWEKSS